MNPRLVAATLLLAVAGFALPTSSHAQIIDRFGVKAGVVSASASNNFTFDLSDLGSPGYTNKDFGRRTGLVAGVFAERQVLPLFAVVAEISYVQRGFVETTDEYFHRNVIPADFAATASEASSRLHYLSVPVMGKLSYDLAPAQLYALAGPRLDVLLSRKKGVFKTPNSSLEKSSPYSRGYETWAAGGTAGVGTSVNVGLFPGRLLLEARYDFDVTDSLKWDPQTIRNNAFSIIVGVIL